MSVENKMFMLTIQSSADLTDLTAGTGEINKAVGVTGDVTGDQTNAIGLLKETADNTGHISLVYAGLSKYTAAAAITAGEGLTVTTSGYLTTVTSGSIVVGRNLVAAVSSGAVGLGMFNFAVPFFATNSNTVY